MKRFISKPAQKELAMLYLVLKASGCTNADAAYLLNVPWNTLYKWGRVHLGSSGYEINPKICKCLRKAGEYIAHAKELPLQSPRRRPEPMTTDGRLQTGKLRMVSIEAFLSLQKQGYSAQEAGKLIGRSVSTLKRWLRLHQKGGLDSLVPSPKPVPKEASQ